MCNYKNKFIKALKTIIISISTILLLMLMSLIVGATIIRNGTAKIVKEKNDDIKTLVSSIDPDQVRGGKVFISCYEHVSCKPSPFFSLFCDGKGQRLTSAKGKYDFSTGLPVGFLECGFGRTEKTDEGTKLHLYIGEGEETLYKGIDYREEFTISDIKDKGASIAKADKEAKERADELIGEGKTISYGYYTVGEVKDAKPIEAWVLKEMKENKSYHSKVQYAWWLCRESEGGTSGSGSSDSTITIKNYDPNVEEEDNIYYVPEDHKGNGNAIYAEAQAFEEYVSAISGSTDPGTNSAGLFSMDYRKKLKPMDTSNVNVLFNAERNVYIVGPISIEYVRRGTKCGGRDAVDFCGINGASLTYRNESGSSTKLNLKHEYYEGTKGFRIVYDHERTMASYDVNKYSEYSAGNNFYYPYPYSEEKFYIEIDYLDDVVSVEEFALDFHWVNAGAKYEDITEGNAYITKWEGDYEYKDTIEHVDNKDTHGPYDTPSECHEHMHESYTFDYQLWGKKKSVTAIETQPLINCISTVTVDYLTGSGGDSTDSSISSTVIGKNENIWSHSNIVIGSSEDEEKDPHSSTSTSSDASINYNIGETAGALRVCAGGWDLTTEIAGFAWLEGIKYEKGTAFTGGNSKYDKEPDEEGFKDKRMKNIEVRVYKVVYKKEGGTYKETNRTLADAYGTKKYNKNGTVLLENKYDYNDNRIYTNDKGEYRVFLRVPSIGEKTPNQKIVYDIEFIYDGQTYETVEYLVTTGKDNIADKVAVFQKIAEDVKGTGGKIDYSEYKNDSYIVENQSFKDTTKSGDVVIPQGRQNFDDNFVEIYGNSDSKIKDDKTSTGKAKGHDKKNSKYDEKIDLSYKGKMYSELIEERDDSVDIVNEEDDRVVSQIVTKDSNGKVLDKYKLGSRTSTGSFMLPYADYIYIRHYSGTIMKNDVDKFYQLESRGTVLDGKETWYYPIYEYFHQVNMGLTKREDIDLSVSKDLYKSEVIVNQQEVTYKYNTLRDYEKEDNGEYLNTLIKMQSVNQKYSLGLYPSDFYYRSDVYKKSDKVDSDIAKIIHDWKKRF